MRSNPRKGPKGWGLKAAAGRHRVGSGGASEIANRLNVGHRQLYTRVRRGFLWSSNPEVNAACFVLSFSWLWWRIALFDPGAPSAS